MDISIGMSLDRAEGFFAAGLKAVEVARSGGGHLDFTEYGIMNSGREVTLQVTNDDMERDEVADALIVDIEQ